MHTYINRQDVYNYVASTLPYASFDSEAEYNIDGIVDIVIASIPDLIGEHYVNGTPLGGVGGIIDSLIEDEEGYWSVVAEHQIRGN